MGYLYPEIEKGLEKADRSNVQRLLIWTAVI